MTSKPSVSLIIGLGQTGAQTAALLWQDWSRLYPSHAATLGVITVDFAPALPALSQAGKSHLHLSIDVAETLERLARLKDTTHLASWFDVQEWGASWARFSDIPRPIERLAWFEALSEAENSVAYRIWNQQLGLLGHHKRKQESSVIPVFLIADLSEPAGSSLMLDLAFFTRQMAALDVPLVLWGYTVLPGRQATDSAKLRAFAALRELTRFMSPGIRPPYGYPFDYLPVELARQEPDLWRGKLRENPLDLWYCFEGDTAAARMAGVIQPLLESAVQERAQQNNLNLTAQIARQSRQSVMVGTANSRSIVLPVAELQKHWAAELLRDALKPGQDQPDLAFQITSLAQAIWQTRTPFNSLQQVVAQYSNKPQGRILGDYKNKSTQEVVKTVEAWLYWPASGARRYPSLVSSLEEIFRELETLSRADDVHLMLRRVKSAFARLGSGSFDENTGQFAVDLVALGDDVSEDHVSWFREVWREALLALLNGLPPSPVTALHKARLLADQLLNALDQVGQGLKALQPSVTNLKLGYRQYTNAEALLGRELSRSGPRIGRGAVRDLSGGYQQAAVQYAATLQLSIYLGVCVAILRQYGQELTAIKTELEAWQNTLQTLHNQVDQMANEAALPALTVTSKPVIESCEHPWARAQQRRYLQNSGGLAAFQKQMRWEFSWQKELRLALHWGEMALLPDANAVFDKVWQPTIQVFARASQETTLLAYLVDQDQSLGDIDAVLSMLNEAKQNFLKIERTRQWFGQLYAFEDDSRSDEYRYLEEATARLRDLNHFMRDDAQTIQRQGHGNPQSMTYLYVVEKIDLVNEVECYSELERFYLRHLVEASKQHVMGAELWAARLEQHLQPARLLCPQVISLLYLPDDLLLFWMARKLGFVQRQVSVLGKHQYVMDIDREAWGLTPLGEMKEDAALLLDAIHAFLENQAFATQEMYDRNSYVDVSAIKQALRSRCDDAAWQMARDLPNVDSNLLKQLGLSRNLEAAPRDIQFAVGKLKFFQDYARSLSDEDQHDPSPEASVARDLFIVEMLMIQNEQQRWRKQVDRYVKDQPHSFGYGK